MNKKIVLPLSQTSSFEYSEVAKPKIRKVNDIKDLNKVYI